MRWVGRERGKRATRTHLIPMALPRQVDGRKIDMGDPSWSRGWAYARMVMSIAVQGILIADALKVEHLLVEEVPG